MTQTAFLPFYLFTSFQKKKVREKTDYMVKRQKGKGPVIAEQLPVFCGARHGHE